MRDRAAAVALVGDVMIREPLARSGAGSREGYRQALAALNEAALVIVNLEMPLSRRGYRVPKHSNLRSDPEVIADVAAMGAHAVTLANNHMLDYGPDALRDTLEACAGAGLIACGAGIDLEEALRPAILRCGDHTVALLSVASTLPVESDAGPGKPGIAPLRVDFSFEIDANLLVEQPGTMPLVRSRARRADQELICERVAQLKREADLVIVAIHWGVPSYWLSPYQGLLAEYQQPLGHALIDAGADLVAGHHSHSLHPIEIYRGRPIFYSLGNFVFEQPRAFMEPESVIAYVTPGEHLAIELVPLLLDEQGFPARVTGAEAVAVLQKLAALCAPYGTALQIEGDRAHLMLRVDGA